MGIDADGHCSPGVARTDRRIDPGSGRSVHEDELLIQSDGPMRIGLVPSERTWPPMIGTAVILGPDAIRRVLDGGTVAVKVLAAGLDHAERSTKRPLEVRAWHPDRGAGRCMQAGE